MQANAANEHSQLLAQIPANACSDLESRTGMCSLVLLLVSYSTLVWGFPASKNKQLDKHIREPSPREVDQR